ncbi:hypothetical protein [Pandoraea pulmonicola]|nr:hypothetical protein [Pandoraea pulmonicola]SUA92695.1 Uncharacterised protein [Pandoraea pulmonicola]
MKLSTSTFQRGWLARGLAGLMAGATFCATGAVFAQTLDFSRFMQSVNSSSTQPAGPVTPGVAPVAGSTGTYVQVLDGLINVTNPGGAQTFGPGRFGFTPQNMTPPVVVLPVNPGLLFAPRPVFLTAQPSGPKGDPDIVIPIAVPASPEIPTLPPPVVVLPLLSGAGYTFANWGSDGIANLGVGPAVFDSQSVLTKFTGTTSPFMVNSAVTAANAGHLNDLGWGRWVAGTVTDHGLPIDLTTLPSGMPYVVGRLTPDAALPVSGTMTYTLAGATPAIDRLTGAIGQLSGSLSIAFVSGSYSVTPNLNIAMNAGPKYVTGAGTTTVGADGSRAAFITLTQNVTGGACTGGNCTLTTQGMLTGAAANNAGLVYSLRGPDVQVTGAAGFKR